MNLLLQHPPQDDLQGLLQALDQQYYTVIEAMLERISMYIARLHDGDVHQLASRYTGLAHKLVEQVEYYMLLRHRLLYPYVQELLDKEAAGHDCRSCSASCTSRHASRIGEIRAAHSLIKETLYQLRSVSVPAGGYCQQQDVYRALCHEVRTLDDRLCGLFLVEESSLVPGLITVQQNIHAHD